MFNFSLVLFIYLFWVSIPYSELGFKTYLFSRFKIIFFKNEILFFYLFQINYLYLIFKKI
jgi:hypothetical protein